MSVRFNPRTPAGCDPRKRRHSASAQSFNPRTPAGCDLVSLWMVALGLLFQSTHPCGVRPAVHITILTTNEVSIHAPLRGATLRRPLHAGAYNRFNPRTPAGCDNSVDQVFEQTLMFQSTHPCGVRPGGPSVTIPPSGFQSTHPCGVRRECPGRTSTAPAFQSTHPCGVRLLMTLGLWKCPKSFNPRTPAGCDPRRKNKEGIP